MAPQSTPRGNNTNRYSVSAPSTATSTTQRRPSTTTATVPSRPASPTRPSAPIPLPAAVASIPLAMDGDASAADRIKRFQRAVETLQNLPKGGTAGREPNNDEKLMFYGLYKQSTVGPVNIDKPSYWDVVARAKWDAWSGNGTISKEEAMNRYVAEVLKFIQPLAADHPQIASLVESLQVSEAPQTRHAVSLEQVSPVSQVSQAPPPLVEPSPLPSQLTVNVSAQYSSLPSAMSPMSARSNLNDNASDVESAKYEDAMSTIGTATVAEPASIRSRLNQTEERLRKLEAGFVAMQNQLHEHAGGSATSTSAQTVGSHGNPVRRWRRMRWFLIFLLLVVLFRRNPAWLQVVRALLGAVLA